VGEGGFSHLPRTEQGHDRKLGKPGLEDGMEAAPDHLTLKFRI
jgi:hypothetical protein